MVFLFVQLEWDGQHTKTDVVEPVDGIVEVTSGTAHIISSRIPLSAAKCVPKFIIFHFYPLKVHENH